MPTSSVTTNFKNLKSEFPSIFRRLWYLFIASY
jgi:hypothetical protein